MIRKYGIDVSSYQLADLATYHRAGAHFAIIKLTEGTSYVNPKSKAQIASSRKNHMYTHAYHFANFGNSVTKAKKEAKFFIKAAQLLKISKKRILWLDWEQSPNNKVTGSVASNTQAILAFMAEVKKAGWRPGLYSGAYLLRTSIDTSKIIKKYGTCLWVASYQQYSPTSQAIFTMFPSMDGVAIWQFTSNWKGLNVDGNVAVVDLNQQG